ncbi:MAG: zinc ABC transporter substrate-binding protein [Candidatus Omnitrophica bacterium]|nr:zinc ABC transporter substrate-binding protein [Candidatus Omnitrophota bacterium]
MVATLSTFADLAKTVGGEHVNVSTIAPATFNPHFIEPKPSDVLKVKRAALLIHAGLDLELWRWPLLDAAGNTRLFPGQPGELDLSQGIPLLEVPTRVISRAEGDIHIYGNPHYWLDPENAKVMAQAIGDKLSAIDPAHEQDYRRNLQDFLTRLDQKISEWKARLAPYQGQELVGYHKEWPYLMRFAGLKMEQYLEPKPGIPPTPKQVQFIEGYMRDHRIPAVVQATYFPRRTSDAVARDTGASVVLLCQNARELPACSDYLSMLEYNVTQLVGALEQGAPAGG